jgi:hypothetical protein
VRIQGLLRRKAVLYKSLYGFIQPFESSAIGRPVDARPKTHARYHLLKAPNAGLVGWILASEQSVRRHSRSTKPFDRAIHVVAPPDTGLKHGSSSERVRT